VAYFLNSFWAHIKARHIYGNTFIGIHVSDFQENLDEEWTISKCEHCDEKMIWLDDKIIYPKKIIVDSPNDDLSGDIKKIIWKRLIFLVTPQELQLLF